MQSPIEAIPERARARSISRRSFLLLAGSTTSLVLLAACRGAAPEAPPAGTQAPPAARTMAPVTPPQAAAPAATGTPRDGGTFRIYLHTENAPTLDPHLTVTFRSQDFAAFFYSRLLMSKKGPGIPGLAYIMEGDLAESWKADEEGKTWTFNLRPDVKWHNKPPMNGRPLTAADVAWSFERFMKVSPQKPVFDQVAEISAPNERTVQFKLKDVYAPFETAIGAPVFWVLPKELIEQDGDASKRAVGTGPFVFDKYESGVGFTGNKNPAYHRRGEPHVDELNAIMIPDVATRMAGLRARELDGAEVEQQDLDSLKQTNPDIQVVEVEWNYNPFIYWKLDLPPFNDVRVRQAVSMSIDRDELLKATFNGRGGWNTSLPWAYSSWWLDPRGPDFGPNAKYFKYDPAEARKLLAAAGYPDGLKVDMIASPGYGEPFVQRVEVIQQSLKSGGIEANIKMQEYSAYISTTYLGKFEGGNVLVLGLTGASFTDPSEFYMNHYHPKGPRNSAGVNDPKLTEMIEKQARTMDKAERKKQLDEIQRYLAEQVYYATSAAGYRSMAYQPYVRDAYPRSDFGLGAEVIPKLWLDK